MLPSLPDNKMGAEGRPSDNAQLWSETPAMSGKSWPGLTDPANAPEPMTDVSRSGGDSAESARAAGVSQPRLAFDGNAASSVAVPGTSPMTSPSGHAVVGGSSPAVLPPGESVHLGAPAQDTSTPAAQVAATPPTRPDGRHPDELRPIQIVRPAWGLAPGRVLFCMGRTAVLCTCSIESSVPAFLIGSGKGWLTAEYNMLPGSTAPRKPRAGIKPDGRSIEIQRLIGRSLRTCLRLEKLGERTLWIDCDVLQADGGTRTASINGGFLALVDALVALRDQLPNPLSEILVGSVAAVSVGLWHGQRILDLNYAEDKDAAVDLNLVMTGDGRLVEVQAGGEEDTFALDDLHALLDLGRRGIARILEHLRQALGDNWPAAACFR